MFESLLSQQSTSHTVRGLSSSLLLGVAKVSVPLRMRGGSMAKGVCAYAGVCVRAGTLQSICQCTQSPLTGDVCCEIRLMGKGNSFAESNHSQTRGQAFIKSSRST